MIRSDGTRSQAATIKMETAGCLAGHPWVSQSLLELPSARWSRLEPRRTLLGFPSASPGLFLYRPRQQDLLEFRWGVAATLQNQAGAH